MVADELRSRPLTVEQLATKTCIHPRTVYRILDALKEAGYRLSVREAPRSTGRGRPERRYQLAAHGEGGR